MEYIQAHFTEKLTVDMLANIAGVSTRSYAKLFKMLSGYNPMEFIIHLRINRSKELMEIPGRRLKDIAQSVGYQDEFYFSRIFKKFTGIPPKQYMKQSE
jgi:AraC-like DNA-binding protein